jgi:hypothetical protein
MNIIIVSLMFLNSSSLPLLLALSSFWGFIFTVKRFTKLQTGFIPLFVLSSLATLGYFACFFTIFKGFNLFLMLFGNSLLLLEVFFLGKDLIKKKLTLRSYLLAQKTVFFFIFCSVALFFYINNASLYGWDEFFWGQFSKFIHQYGHFWQLGDAVLSSHSVYPPMVAISQNLFMPFGTFNEEAMFFANLLPITFVFTYLFDSITRSGITKRNILILGIIFSLIYWDYFYFCFTNFNYNFASVDHAMAMIFTITILFVYEKRKDGKQLFFLLPILFFLTLYKTTGLLLAGTSVVIFQLPKIISLLNKRKSTSTKHVFLLVLAFLLTTFIAYMSWNTYTQVTKLTNTRTTQRSISTFNKTELENIYYSQVATNFLDALTNKSLNFGVGIVEKVPQLSSLAFWFIFILVYQAIILAFEKRNAKKQQKTIFFLVMDSCFILWILFHLYIWLFVFSEYEGLLLASYERYLNTFLVSIFILTSYLLSKEALKNSKALTFLIALAIFLNLSFCITKKSIFIGPRFFADHSRVYQTSLSSKVQEKIKGEKAKVWYINQNSIGYEAMIFRYEMSPKYYVQVWNWSLGSKYYPEDVWSTDLSIVEFQDLLLGNSDNPKIPYSFIVLGKVDQQFQDQYGELFSEKTSNDTLWQLQESDGSVKAIPIPL